MLFGSWQELFRTVASCITPEMSERPNYALASVLDAADRQHTISAGVDVHENGDLGDRDVQQALDGEFKYMDTMGTQTGSLYSLSLSTAANSTEPRVLADATLLALEGRVGIVPAGHLSKRCTELLLSVDLSCQYCRCELRLR